MSGHIFLPLSFLMHTFWDSYNEALKFEGHKPNVLLRLILVVTSSERHGGMVEHSEVSYLLLSAFVATIV